MNKTDIDLFIVATRHNTHYQIATDLLNNNKNILLEKPLCLNETDLQNFIHNIYNKTKIPMFTIGFNRRYSPITIAIQKHLQNRNGPIMINYRINDEHLPNNH